MNDRSGEPGAARSTAAARIRSNLPVALSLAIAGISLYTSLWILSSQWLHYSWNRISSHVPGNAGIARALEHLRDKGENLQWIDLTPIIARAHADGGGVPTGDKKRAVIRGVNLAGVDLSHAWFDDTDFSNAVLTGSNLSRVKARDAIFRKVNLRDAVMKHAWFDDTDFSNAVLTGSNLSQVKARDAIFRKVNLKEAVMKKALFDRSDLSEVNMTGVEADELHLTYATLTKGKFGGSSMNRANLRWAKAFGASFVDSGLRGANLSRGVFTASSFENARLAGATLTGGHYSKVKFIGANLANAVLDDGYYGDADFTGANLSGVEFIGTSVPRTDFSAANLSGVKFVGAKGFDSVKWDGVWAWKDRPPEFPKGVEVNVILCDTRYRQEWKDRYRAWEKGSGTAGATPPDGAARYAIPEDCRPSARQ